MNKSRQKKQNLVCVGDVQMGFGSNTLSWSQCFGLKIIELQLIQSKSQLKLEYPSQSQLKLQRYSSFNLTW